MTEKKKSQKTKGMIMALMSGICWGFSGTCGQYLFTYTDVSVNILSCVRMLGGGIMLIILGMVTQRENMSAIWRDKQDIAKLFVFAILGLQAVQYTYLAAISHSNAGTATVLQYTGPALIVLWVCLTQKKLPGKSHVAALLLAFGGVFLLATHGHPGSLALSKPALTWGLSSAVALALYTILPVSLIKKYTSTVVTGYGLIIAGIATVFVTRVWQESFAPSLGAFLGIAGVTVLGTAVAFILYMQGVAYAGPDKGSLLACTEPVAATVFAALWLKTPFYAIDWLGFAAILGAVILLTILGSEEKESESTTSA